MRAIWNGHITFGLVSIPVGLYSAVEASEHVSFRLLHRKDMAPIAYKKFCSKEDVEVDNDEIVKGYKVGKNRYATVEKEELEKVEEGLDGAGSTIEVLQFVDFGSLNPLSFETPYYLAPQKGGEKAYGVLREALAETRRVGMVRFALRKKPVLGAMMPGKRAIALEVIRPFEELRDPSDLPIPAPGKSSAEVKMARLLIDQLSGEEWDPTAHPNEYKKALEKLLASKKQVTVAPKGGPAREEGKVVDLMEALRRSVGNAKSRPKRAVSHRKAGAA
jgi:DNA end-binding protein Ku